MKQTFSQTFPELQLNHTSAEEKISLWARWMFPSCRIYENRLRTRFGVTPHEHTLTGLRPTQGSSIGEKPRTGLMKSPNHTLQFHICFQSEEVWSDPSHGFNLLQTPYTVPPSRLHTPSEETNLPAAEGSHQDGLCNRSLTRRCLLTRYMLFVQPLHTDCSVASASVIDLIWMKQELWERDSDRIL